MILPAILGAVAVIGAAGRALSRRLSRRLDDRFERDEQGVIRGAGPIALPGDRDAAVLLVHGGGDTPQTMRHLADAFHQRGYAVIAPLLPGHGRDLDAFDRSTADAWYEEVHRQFTRMRSAHDFVGVVGISMGAALSARLAAEMRSVDALVLCSPYLSMPPIGSLLARTARVWGTVVPVVSTASDRSVFDPEARAVSLGYGAFTKHSLSALRLTAARGLAALPDVSAPTLVMQSTTDNRVTTEATKRAFESIGATEKEMEFIEGSGHVITVDYGWQHVTARAVNWVERHRVEKRTGRREGAPAF